MVGVDVTSPFAQPHTAQHADNTAQGSSYRDRAELACPLRLKQDPHCGGE